MLKTLSVLAISFIIATTSLQSGYAQRFQHSILGGANLPLGVPEAFNFGVIVEYDFEILLNKYFSVGISPVFNIINYKVTTYDHVGTTITKEREMAISSGIPSWSVYPKVNIPISNSLSFYFASGVGGYFSMSSAYLTTVDYITSDIEVKGFNSKSKFKLGLNTSIGLLIDYNDKFDIITKLSWFNANAGNSMNNLKFEGEWPDLNVESSIISISVGATFPLFRAKK